jgi:hypothetical protein
MSSAHNELNGGHLYATNGNKTDTEGVLVTTGLEQSVFFFDNSTGHLATVSDISGETRFGYTLYSNYTGSVFFDVPENHENTTVYYPKFAFVDDGGWFVPPGNLSFIWCQEGSQVDDPSYVPASVAISLTRILDDCYAISSLTGIYPS